MRNCFPEMEPQILLEKEYHLSLLRWLYPASSVFCVSWHLRTAEVRPPSRTLLALSSSSLLVLSIVRRRRERWRKWRSWLWRNTWDCSEIYIPSSWLGRLCWVSSHNWLSKGDFNSHLLVLCAVLLSILIASNKSWEEGQQSQPLFPCWVSFVLFCVSDSCFDVSEDMVVLVAFESFQISGSSHHIEHVVDDLFT